MSGSKIITFNPSALYEADKANTALNALLAEHPEAEVYVAGSGVGPGGTHSQHMVTIVVIWRPTAH